jgi:hypothetical protein
LVFIFGIVYRLSTRRIILIYEFSLQKRGECRELIAESLALF